jgi:four helix bundle protein
MRYQRFEEMEVWQLRRQLLNDVYAHSQKGSVARDFGFTDQIRRAGISIMNNIAEGFECKSNKEFVRYLYISKSSCGEVRSMLYLAFDLQYINEETFRKMHAQTETISKSLSGMIKYLTTHKPPSNL